MLMNVITGLQALALLVVPGVGGLTFVRGALMYMQGGSAGEKGKELGIRGLVGIAMGLGSGLIITWFRGLAGV
jgi:hypothetical protein